MNQRETRRLFAWWLEDRGFKPKVLKTRMRFRDRTLSCTWVEIRVITSKRVELYRMDYGGNLLDSFMGDNWSLTAEGLAISNERGEIEWIIPTGRLWE